MRLLYLLDRNIFYNIVITYNTYWDL